MKTFLKFTGIGCGSIIVLLIVIGILTAIFGPSEEELAKHSINGSEDERREYAERKALDYIEKNKDSLHVKNLLFLLDKDNEGSLTPYSLKVSYLSKKGDPEYGDSTLAEVSVTATNNNRYLKPHPDHGELESYSVGFYFDTLGNIIKTRSGIGYAVYNKKRIRKGGDYFVYENSDVFDVQQVLFDEDQYASYNKENKERQERNRLAAANKKWINDFKDGVGEEPMLIQMGMEDAVKRKFNYPASVEFRDKPYIHKVKIKDAFTGKCYVNGKCTGKNAFGVPLEYLYEVELTLLPDKKTIDKVTLYN